MVTRSLFTGLAAAGLTLFVGLSVPASAAPGPVLATQNTAQLLQTVGENNRRWRYRNGTYVRAPFAEVDDSDEGTWVAAPFARVYSGRRGTWVRAPFVNLWIPR
jgi:hypothetical protein